MTHQMGPEDGEAFSGENDNPPAYVDTIGGESDSVQARVDGRFDVKLSARMAKTLSHLMVPQEPCLQPPPSYRPPTTKTILSLNIVIQVVGSRGDVQPFVALGNELQRNGHRVRIATHDIFKKFVTTADLEFFPIGGDPEALMAYMVKNPGLLPSMTALRYGEIQQKRDMMAEMLGGCWRACIEPDLDSNVPFVADAIIANPPSFAHVHCAEALGIPVHIMFTMPWTSTGAFPHPLANIKSTIFDDKLTNRLSYGIVDWMMWQGLGDVVNRWRKKQDLEPVPASEGPFLPDLLKIPTTYCWSPALVAKPLDWPDRIEADVSGFFFRDPPQYSPPPEIEAFMRAGPAPVYIGFGSIVIDRPDKLTCLILEAVKTAGVRAVISRGWSGLGKSGSAQFDDVIFIGDCPHEWLFQHVRVVVHHGGAGTTACGLANACPTVIVPFFGDQPFWGSMVATAGAGPVPIPHLQLSSSNLAAAIRFCLSNDAVHAAKSIAERMRGETGVKTSVDSFHRNLKLDDMSCDLLPQYAATWQLKHIRGTLKLSKVAAEILISKNMIREKDIKMFQSKPIIIETRRWDLVTASTSSMIGVSTDLVTDASEIFTRPYIEYQQARKDGPSSTKNGKTAGNMALASAKSIGNFNGHFFKGTMVDIPLAITEGLRATPKLYGDTVPDHEPITDWKSGIKVAGKELVHGFGGGLGGFVMDPYRGAKNDGFKGFITGFGKGSVVGITTKTTSGAIGLVGYSGQGIYKSIYGLVHSTTRKTIIAARRQEGAYLLPRHEVDVTAVMEAWIRHTSQS